MNRPQPNDQTGEDFLLLLIVGFLAVVALGHWLLGSLAALIGRGRLLHASMSDALTAFERMPDHTDDPRRAWGPKAAANLPGPIMYWASFAIVAIGLLAAMIFLLGRLSRRQHEPADKRRRLGVEAQARLASAKDLRPLLTHKPTPGRFVIARWHPDRLF